MIENKPNNPLHSTTMPSALLARRLRSSLWCQKRVVASDRGRWDCGNFLLLCGTRRIRLQPSAGLSDGPIAQYHQSDPPGFLAVEDVGARRGASSAPGLSRRWVGSSARKRERRWKGSP